MKTLCRFIAKFTSFGSSTVLSFSGRSRSDHNGFRENVTLFRFGSSPGAILANRTMAENRSAILFTTAVVVGS